MVDKSATSHSYHIILHHKTFYFSVIAYGCTPFGVVKSGGSNLGLTVGVVKFGTKELEISFPRALEYLPL